MKNVYETNDDTTYSVRKLIENRKRPPLPQHIPPPPQHFHPSSAICTYIETSKRTCPPPPTNGARWLGVQQHPFTFESFIFPFAVASTSQDLISNPNRADFNSKFLFYRELLNFHRRQKSTTTAIDPKAVPKREENIIYFHARTFGRTRNDPSSSNSFK